MTPRRAKVEQRAPNDPRQYDDLVDEWWAEGGAFAALRWLAESRASLVPPAPPGAILLDVGAGAGLLAPHVEGYRHIGVDLVASALRLARGRGVLPVVGRAEALPARDAVADVVVAGELFEHLEDLPAAVAEIARVLRPGGVLLFDTIARTAWARVALVWVAERLPGGPPPRIHRPDLFVDPRGLARLLRGHGFRAWFRGLRPSAADYLRFLRDRRSPVRLVPTRSLAGLYQGVAIKAPVGTTPP